MLSWFFCYYLCNTLILRNHAERITVLSRCASSPPPSASLPAGPPSQVSPDDAEQQAALLLACSGTSVPAPLPPIGMYDLLEALQVRSALADSLSILINGQVIALPKLID